MKEAFESAHTVTLTELREQVELLNRLSEGSFRDLSLLEARLDRMDARLTTIEEVARSLRLVLEKL